MDDPGTTKSHRAHERGAGLTEYGLLLVLIMVAAIPAVMVLSPAINGMFNAAAGMF